MSWCYVSVDERATRWRSDVTCRTWSVGTRERTGEGLAVYWEQLDLEEGVADWGGGVIRIKGKGQQINMGKTRCPSACSTCPAG